MIRDLHRRSTASSEAALDQLLARDRRRSGPTSSASGSSRSTTSRRFGRSPRPGPRAGGCTARRRCWSPAASTPRPSRERTLRDMGFDLAFLGEADVSLVRFADTGDPRSVPGIASAEQPASEFGPKQEILDELPFPDWSLVDYRFYAQPSRGKIKTRYTSSLDLIMGRGCVYKCSFCAYPTLSSVRPGPSTSTTRSSGGGSARSTDHASTPTSRKGASGSCSRKLSGLPTRTRNAGNAGCGAASRRRTRGADRRRRVGRRRAAILGGRAIHDINPGRQPLGARAGRRGLARLGHPSRRPGPPIIEGHGDDVRLIASDGRSLRLPQVRDPRREAEAQVARALGDRPAAIVAVVGAGAGFALEVLESRPDTRSWSSSPRASSPWPGSRDARGGR